MSLLIAESHANPTTPVWGKSNARSVAGAQGLTGVFTGPDMVIASSTFTVPKASTVVVIADANFTNSAGSTATLTAYVKNATTSTQSNSYITEAAGGTKANAAVTYTESVAAGSTVALEFHMNSTVTSGSIGFTAAWTVMVFETLA